LNPRKADHLYTHRLGRELIVLDTEANVAHTLNETASLLWSLCDGTRTADDLAAVMLARYRVEDVTARTDVERVLRQLRSLHLLQEE
jgi:hypothetical protein